MAPPPAQRSQKPSSPELPRHHKKSHLVVGQQLILERLHAHEPRGARELDQGRVGAPAERVAASTTDFEQAFEAEWINWDWEGFQERGSKSASRTGSCK